MVNENDYFIQLEESVPMWRKEIPELRIEVNQIFTIVEKKKGFYLKIQPFISLHLPVFLVLRFLPYPSEVLEISRI